MLSPSMRHTSTSLLPYHPLHSPAPSSDLNTSSSSPSTSASSSKSELTLTVTTMHPPTPHTIDCPGHCIIPCSDPSCWTTLNPKTSGVEEECTGECRIIECDESVCGGDFDEGCDDLHCHAQDCDGSIGCDVNDGWHNWHCDTGECTTTDYTQMLDCCQSAKTLIGLGASSSSSFQNVTQMSNATSSEIDAFLNDYSFAHLDSIFPSHQHLPSTHIPYSKPLDYTYNPPTSSSSHLPLPFACQWSGCKHSFSSMPELVGHVNLAHLRLSSSSPPTTPSSLSTSSANSNAEPLSCLWADCHIHPSLLSLPPTSQTQTSEADLYALAAHLLHDHLGLSPPSQPPTPALTLYSSSPRPSTSASASSSPSSIVIQESGSCKCKWSNCGLCFNNVEELTNHISEKHVGSGKNAYECFWEGCTRNGTNCLTSKQKILRHIQTHTGHRPFQCPTCSQYFSEAATLQQHMRRHTQEKPYICDFEGCGKAFAIAGALTIHKRMHNGDKPFKCSYCGRAFAESSNLSKHLRTHTGARPYACTLPHCDKRFSRPDQLSRHVRSHERRKS